MDPQEIVNQAEAAYQSGDIDRIMELFDPEIVIYWNGWKKVEGLEAARKMHEDAAVVDDAQETSGPHKTLRAASGDTIAVEGAFSRTFADGSHHEAHFGEFWKMRDDHLLEWNAYWKEYDEDGEPVSHSWDGPHEY